MNGWVILFNVVVAGIVGGITNHLAIKMLFHPRRPVRLGRWKLPFTPGLIPKRKREIAASLGEVVSDYLVTPEGIQELFSQQDFRQSLVGKAKMWADREIGREATVGSLLRRWLGEERAENGRVRAPVYAADWAERAFAAWWASGRYGERQISETVPGWSREMVREWSELAASWGLEVLKRQLISAEGQTMLRKLAASLMDRTGGFIGMLAGIFVDEDKWIARLTPFLLQQLDGPTIRSQAAEMIGKQLSELGGKTLDEAWLELAAGAGSLEGFIRRWMREQLPWADWVGRIDKFPLGEWLGSRVDARDRWLERIVLTGLDGIGRLAPGMIAAIRLPELVRTQVERFPVERLEQVILNVSGKEFKAITWLGVALGGFIGLLQSLMMLLWR